MSEILEASPRSSEILSSFEQELSAPDAPEQDAPQEDAQAEEVTEQIPADEADDSGEQEEAVEAEPKAEGPSAFLKSQARLAGLRDSLVAIARDDAQLQQMIDDALDAKDAGEQEPEKQEPEPEPEPDSDFFEDLFSEDEFDPSDPSHKAIKGLLGKLNEFDKRQKQRDALFARFANEQIEREKAREQAEIATQAKALYDPFDAVLDEYGVEAFGNKEKGLTKAQQAVRKELAEYYVGLKARPDLPEETKRHLAETAIRAYRRDLAEAREQKQQQVKKQAKQRTGGNGKVDPRPRAQTRSEAIDEFDDFLAGRVTFDLD